MIFVTAIVSAVILSNCATLPDTELQKVSGTFSGKTGDGKPIVLTLEQEGNGFSGNGTIAGKPIVVSGAQTWQASGSIVYPDGSSSLIKLILSADNKDLVIENIGQKPIKLKYGGTPAPQPSGPFSGNYRSVGQVSALASVKITQNGSLVTGVGELLGQTVSIAGKAITSHKAKGFITFIDESQAGFEAELSHNGKWITISGLGSPAILVRK